MGEILKVGSRKHQKQRKHLTWVGQNARRATEMKYDSKMKHLIKKHRIEERNERRKEYMVKWKDKHPNLEVYRELEGEEPDEIEQEDVKVFNTDSQQMGCKI